MLEGQIVLAFNGLFNSQMTQMLHMVGDYMTREPKLKFGSWIATRGTQKTSSIRLGGVRSMAVAIHLVTNYSFGANITPIQDILSV